MLTLLALAASGNAAAPDAFARPARGAASANPYLRLPLQFEENQGQTAKSVGFLSRGPGYRLFLSPTGAVFVPTRSLRKDAAPPSAVRMTLVGSNHAARLLGQDALRGRVNYLLGKDPRHWVRNVRTFRRVRSVGVYDGIDLVYYGTRKQIEYDFIIGPGADSNAIRLSVSGQGKARIDRSGALSLATAGGQIRWKPPVAYQDVRGRRVLVAAKYRCDERGWIGFRLGAHDPHAPLIIDPVVSYVSYFGETQDEAGYAIAADKDGAAYVTGNATFPPFPITSGAYQTTGGGVFISKFNAAGDALVYSTYIGSYGSDSAYGIAVDGQGNAYVTGRAHPSFPTTAGAYATSSPLGGAFVAKLDPTGSSLIYSTFLNDASYTAWGSGIAVDASGKIWITGAAIEGFPTTVGALSRGSSGGPHGFVAKLDPAQSGAASLLYSTYLGGSSRNGDAGLGIAVDAAGNAYVGGQTSSSDFPTTPGAYQTQFGGGRSFGNSDYGPFYSGFGDGFISKFSPAGALLYSTYLGTASDDFVRGIAVDSQGNAYVTGTTTSAFFPTTGGVFNSSQGGGSFVTKINAAGSALVYSGYVGNQGYAQAIALDALGDVFLTGCVSGSVPTTPDAYQKTFGGGGTTNNEGDAFLEEISPDCTHLLYATYLGGTRIDSGYGVAVDPIGNIYVTGKAFSADLPVTPGAFQTVFGNGPTVDIYHDYGDIFLAKFVLNQPTPVLNALTDAVPGLSPASAEAGGKDFLLTVHGTAFVAGAVITFGGTTLPTTVLSATAATATVPASKIAAAGSAPVSLTNPAPGGGVSNVVAFTISPESGPTHLLWTNTNGAASVWNYNMDAGAFTQNTYGPFAGWTAQAIADGGTDARTRVLWTTAAGQMSLWSLDSTAAVYTHYEFGPYPGWTAVAVSASKDNTTHVAWDNADGRLSLWNYATAGTFTQNSYGPFPGWTAKATADGLDGKTRVLWDNADGTASLWSLDNTTAVYTHHEFGPYPGWAATRVSVGTDGTTHVLWTNGDGRASLWNYATTAGTLTQNTYGPFGGWTAKTIADDPDGKTRVLWARSDGTLSLWGLNAVSGVYTHAEYGPYPGWAAADVSAGP